MRCKYCKKKMSEWMSYTCKCNGVYCMSCRNSHSCNYEYYNEYQKKLKYENPEIQYEKLERI